MVRGGGGESVTVSTPLARTVVGDNGWWTVYAPTGQEKSRSLGSTFGDAVVCGPPPIRP